MKQIHFYDKKPFYIREGTTDEKVIVEIFERKEYNMKKLGFDFDSSLEGEIWLDLGANIGCFSRLVNMRGGQTLSFEPMKDNFRLLEKNVLNGECINACITNENIEKINIYAPSKVTDHYRFSTKPNTRIVGEVDNINFKLLLDTKFNGVKMDIEGSEFSINDTELMFNTDKLVFEYHFSKDKNMRNFHKRIEILKSHFSIVSYQPFLNKYDLDKPYPLAMDKLIHCVK